MLAQNLKSPTDLRISDDEHRALVSVLGMLERGEITTKHFTMKRTWAECGTVGCLLGWSRFVTKDKHLFPTETISGRSSLLDLFMYIKVEDGYREARPWLGQRECVTVDQAAMALRSYLTTGEANWREALKIE